MFRKTNKIVLNQESVIEAIQDYLDKNFTDCHKVVTLTPIKPNDWQNPWTYEIEIEEVKPNEDFAVFGNNNLSNQL